jgi:hypothetical protein
MRYVPLARRTLSHPRAGRQNVANKFPPNSYLQAHEAPLQR